MTDALISWLRADDARCLALTLHGEARGEPIEGRVAVGCVIRNRARAKYRGTTIADVCLWPSQFSCWGRSGGEDNYAHLTGVAAALMAGTPPPWSEAERLIYLETNWIANGLVSGIIRDRVKSATHYVTRRLYVTDRPVWLKGVEPVCEVGSHCFFAGLK